ncbi:hypothetical protein [Bacillus sp. SM2101]|uniref:hypothetical protein n=1 Tax=Bacillus sp. SM2101 TaxID=2805366 RepID=UPI001BDF5515|nr:hypothetical protein [Bacillus sp. SM2101]
MNQNEELTKFYQEILRKDFKELGVNKINVVTDEQLLVKENTKTVLISSEHILKDNYSYLSPNDLWKSPLKIVSIIIPEQMDNFSFRFTNLQFSPLCYIYNPFRSHIRELSLYLLNKLGFKTEVRL